MSPIQKHGTCRHMKRQPFLHNGCPRHSRLHCHRRRHLRLRLCRRHCCCCRCRCHCNRNRPSPSPLPWAIAAVDMNHCCHQLLPSVSFCRQPSLLPSPLLLAIAVSIIIGHRSCHRCQPSPLPCRWPFLRVVALLRQELYLINQSKECLPYFILFRQWAAY